MQGIGTRYNANVIKDTSDKYLVNPTAKDLELGYEKAEYPQPLDFQYDYEVTPFLKQYISCWYDETRTGTQYAEGGETVKAPMLDSIKEAAMNTANVTQQIVKWGGAEYMSSLGDLSTKYLNELWLSGAKRLKDLIVGSDVPGYFNNLLKTSNFSPDDSAMKQVENEDGTFKVISNPNAKTLLEKIILTNDYKLTFDDNTLDLEYGFSKHKTDIDVGESSISEVAYLIGEFDKNIKEYFIDFDGKCFFERKNDSCCCCNNHFADCFIGQFRKYFTIFHFCCVSNVDNSV